jgi:diguanylate cyclase (GGDEF)-like protein
MQVVETITDVTETKQREQEYRQLKERFEHLAALDPLTGLLNRRGWLEKAERVCRRAAHDALPVEVLIADVDHFKRINDQWGHAMGDRVLRTVASLLQEQCRPGDVIGRWGGEEFIVLLSPPVHDITVSAERVRRHVASCPVPVEGQTETVTMTISVGGAATVPLRGDLQELEALIRIADQRMYQAKVSGRNRVCVA